MSSSTGASESRAKGLARPPLEPSVEVDRGTGYELVIGLRMLVDHDEDPATYAVGPDWFERTRAALARETLDAIERYSGGHEILFGYLLALAADASAPRDVSALLDTVAATSPLELRRLVLGGRLTTYLGDVTRDVVDAAAAGDPGGRRALLAGCLDWQRAPYEHALALDAEEAKRLLELASRGWHAAILGPQEQDVARSLRRSARSASALSRRLRPADLVDVTTKGVRYAGEPGIERILLVPQLVSRPWSIFTEADTTKIVCYGVDESQLADDAPPDPLVAAYKALGDETRLRILRRLSEGTASLVELTELTGLAKSTVHGHLLVLRTAGLVVADGSKRGGYWLRRETLAESAALLETYLERTEE